VRMKQSYVEAWSSFAHPTMSKIGRTLRKPVRAARLSGLSCPGCIRPTRHR